MIKENSNMFGFGRFAKRQWRELKNIKSLGKSIQVGMLEQLQLDIASISNKLEKLNKGLHTQETQAKEIEKIKTDIQSIFSTTNRIEKEERFHNAIRLLKLKYNSGHKIRVAFGIFGPDVFPMEPVFRLMVDDDFFEPFIIVIPNLRDGGPLGKDKEWVRSNYSTTKNRYPNAKIMSSLDEQSNEYIDISSLCDIYCPQNPYDEMTHLYYSTKFFQEKNIPMFFTLYAYNTVLWYDEMAAKRKFFSNFWRVYAESDHTYSIASNWGISPKNICLSGWPRMDNMESTIKNTRTRKKILLCFHWTVKQNLKISLPLNIGKFLSYYELVLELPKLYPDIDFVFRPHPLLLYNLRLTENLWGEEKTNTYLKELGSFNNVEMQLGGPYLESFVNSDAIIQDCGSFIVEYFYTGNPGLYMFKSQDQMQDFNPFVRSCLGHYYHAFNREDIIRFIDDVVIRGNDVKKEQRMNMVKQVKRKYNYPNVSRFILNDIKRQIIEA